MIYFMDDSQKCLRIKIKQQQYSNWQVNMKVQIKSVLKASFQQIRCLDEGQIIHQIGNNLRVYEIGKSESEFINLNKQNSRLFDFVGSPNSRYVFTAEEINNGVEICAYTLSNEKKSIRLSDINNYVPVDLIQNIQLLTDEFESSVVYVITRAKQDTCCITLLDMSKLKLIAHGFLTDFNEASTCSEQTYEVSISGRCFVRRMKAVDGAWVVEEKLPKKLINTQVIFHKWLPLGRCLMATKTQIYIIQEGDIVQTFNITEQDTIFSIVKIAKGFIIFHEKGKIKLYGVDGGEDGLYSQMQELKLNIQKNKVTQVEFNKKSEEIFVATSNGKFYTTRLEETATTGKQNYFNFEEFQLNYSSPQVGSLSTTGGQNYCLISSQRNAELWDMIKLSPIISLQVNNLSQDKVIKASALNSDGHSLCIGFSDRVRFYRILLNKFKQFGQYPLKNTSLIHYSHGGQLIAIIFGKGTNSCLTIINTLNLKEVMNFKLGYKPAQVIWNEYDDEVYVSGQDTKAISVFQISSKSKKSYLQFDKELTFIRFDYLSRKIMASTGSEVHFIDSDHKNETVIKPKIENFDFVFPVEGMYLAADRKGGLYCSPTADFQKYQYLSLFTNERFNLLYRREMLIAYTSPANVIVLKVKLSNQSAKSELIDNVVLVEKDQINKFFDKVKLLQGQLDQLQTSTGIKIEEQRKKYIESLEHNEKIFKGEINFLQKKLQETQVQKSRQQKGNAKVFEQLESGQIKSVNDLQKIYDMKLKLQKQKCLTLEQQSLQQKMKYENIIKALEEKHNNDIERIRKEYSEKLTKEVKAMQVQKQRHNQYKKKVETKLIDLQEEGEMALFQVQLNKDSQIRNLSERLNKLSREHDLKIIALHNMEEAMNELQEKYNDSKDKIKKNEKVVQENINRVLILEKEIEKKNKIIEEKNASIQQQVHQIDGLEKAKYVLSFRTTEVRKQLEPKQLLIEKLKNEMFKLDEEYKSEVKKNFDLAQKLEKLEKITLNYKKQNSEIKTILKNKERIHNDMCSEIFYIVTSTDPKQWNSSFVKIYQNYIKEDKVKVKGQKNDDSTSEQINRHLIHVEQSLHQVATGNQKMLKGKEQEVVRKMKQNAELVYDLNIMRKKQNEYLNDIKQKNTEISRLKRELNEVSGNGHKSTRANTANTGMTRRLASRDTAHQLNNSDWVDLSIKRPSEYLLPDKSKKGRVFSAHKTMVWREENRRQKSKISDLARELESAKNTIMRQDRMIQELNQRLLGIPQEHLS